MKVNIFDDRRSLIHFFMGVLTYWFIFIFVVFLFYQLIEHFYKGKRDHLLGDITEYLYGLSFIYLLFG